MDSNFSYKIAQGDIQVPPSEVLGDDYYDSYSRDDNYNYYDENLGYRDYNASSSSWIVGLIIFFALIYGFVWFLRHISGEGRNKSSNDSFGKVAMGLVIALLLPTAINLMAYSLDTSLTNIWVFLITLVVSTGAFIAGLTAHRNNVISISVVTGSTLSIFYAVLARYGIFPAAAKALSEGVALLLLSYGAYYLSTGRQRGLTWGEMILHGFNGFLLTSVVFLLAWAFSIHTAQMFDESFKMDAYATFSTGGIVYLVVFVIELVIGIIIRRLEPVSRGLIAAGLLGSLLTALPQVINAGTTAAAIITGIVTLVLIFVAYKKFSITEEEHKQILALQTCVHCGAKNQPEAKFCTQCGKSIKE